ncbi:MAG: enoyl-CoA hydratase/isomerase family protein [Planctomycetota bacterium]|nr:enoyl-CoA hydratase/isomerase family protein [Planctomycetota bacterium]
MVTLTLEQPERKVIVLDSDLFRRLDETLDSLGNDLAGFVLTSSTRVFVAGANLEEIDRLSDEELERYLKFGADVFGRIAALPCSTVAAIDGAALGGGLEIAMHCDVLMGLKPGDGDKPYQVGLPEAGLGICPGWGGTNLLPARMDAGEAIRMTITGSLMGPEKALESGLFESLHEGRGALLNAARERAAQPKAKRPNGGEPPNISWPDQKKKVRSALDAADAGLTSSEVGSAIAECVRTGLDEGWAAALETERRSLIHLRGTENARSKLEAFFARSAAKSS